MPNSITSIINFFQNNQVLLTALGLGGAGTIILWLKGVPVAIFNVLKRELTTEVEVSNQNRIFYDILKLVEKMYKDKNLRKLKLSNGKWGDDSRTILTMGYDTHWIIYKHVLLFVTLLKEPGNQTEREKDSLKFLKLGRSHKIFDDLLKEAEEMEEDKSVSRIYKMEDGWTYVKKQLKRPLESIFIEQDKKKLLLNSLSDFINKEEWYLAHGIPYQLGILLYGPPGTGKTSLIKALASYLNYHIYYLPTSRLYRMERASSSLPDKCIMVIEDIDSNFVTMKREEDDTPRGVVSSDFQKSPVIKQESSVDTYMESMEKVALSELLNSLDGLFSSHGRILIATTNHLENLDSAIIRPGRFDIKMEIGYINKETLKMFLDSFFPNNNVDVEGLKLKNNLTIAALQNLILSGYKEDYIINFCKSN